MIERAPASIVMVARYGRNYRAVWDGVTATSTWMWATCPTNIYLQASAYPGHGSRGAFDDAEVKQILGWRSTADDHAGGVAVNPAWG